MNDKVLVRISVPMADIHYDMRIPCDLTCHTVAHHIRDMLERMQGHAIAVSENPVLWIGKAQRIADSGKTLREMGITDSDLLLLL
ncbi:MAG: hypothetical protein IJ246_07165 [Clostridia bacterium]|nr:hypothetical protein [Clostridia bacterium]